MKWFIKRPDLISLWEEDGDLKRMKAFFHTIQSDSEENEQIKQSIKQKPLKNDKRRRGRKTCDWYEQVRSMDTYKVMYDTGA